MNRVAVELTITISTHMSSAEVVELRQQLATMDWAGVHEIDQGGEHSEPFITGGANGITVTTS